MPPSRPAPADVATQVLLALNVGSSSVKFSLFEATGGTPRVTATGQIDGLGAHPRLSVQDPAGTMLAERQWSSAEAPADQQSALELTLQWLQQQFPALRPHAIGHRVVMGGATYDEAVVIDDPVLANLEAMSPLAPLHQPGCLAGIRAARRVFGSALQVGCFDTAFHRTQPFVNDTYALPHRFYDQGVRRYGFHGLSYEFVAGRLAQIAPSLAGARTIVAHLGNGASLCALHHGRSIASSMGFSALDGVPMGTRCGQIDPGVLLWLMREQRMDAAGIEQLLYRESGLKGMSGVSGDLRELLASDEPRAAQAIEHFVARIRREIGALAALLQGVEAIVFTGGIGEHAVDVRAALLDGLRWLGVDPDDAANRRHGRAAGAGDAFAQGLISTRVSKVPVWVIPTDEALTIARQTLKLLGG